MPRKIALLIKIFDNEEFADAFINKGEIFCKKLGHFKKLEGDATRGDKFEAPSDWFQSDRIVTEISFKDKNGKKITHKVENICGPVVSQNLYYDDLNVYCMYAVTVPDVEELLKFTNQETNDSQAINKALNEYIKLDDKIISLGGYAVIIHNVARFFKKIDIKIKKESEYYHRDFVEYFDPDKFHGVFSNNEAAFRKRIIYSYQKEYRFAFKTEKPHIERNYKIGSLKNISIKVKTEEINSRLTMKIK